MLTNDLLSPLSTRSFPLISAVDSFSLCYRGHSFCFILKVSSTAAVDVVKSQQSDFGTGNCLLFHWFDCSNSRSISSQVIVFSISSLSCRVLFYPKWLWSLHLSSFHRSTTCSQYCSENTILGALVELARCN